MARKRVDWTAKYALKPTASTGLYTGILTTRKGLTMSYGSECTDRPMDEGAMRQGIASARAAAGTNIKQTSAMENHLNQDEKQMSFLVETMRRVEEIADRLGGAQPSEESLSGVKVAPPYDGILGSLIRIHDDRQQAVARISQACNRIDGLV